MRFIAFDYFALAEEVRGLGERTGDLHENVESILSLFDRAKKSAGVLTQSALNEIEDVLHELRNAIEDGIESELGSDTCSNDRTAFKQAYDQIGKGRGFVRIHRLREALNWPRDRFDKLLIDLMADYVIELHGGDPSVMSERQIRDSFVDDTGVLYITLTWWGKEE